MQRPFYTVTPNELLGVETRYLKLTDVLWKKGGCRRVRISPKPPGNTVQEKTTTPLTPDLCAVRGAFPASFWPTR